MYTIEKKEIIPVIHMHDKIIIHHFPSLPLPLHAITDQTSSPTTDPDF